MSRVCFRAIQGLKEQNCKGPPIKPPNGARQLSDATDNSIYVKRASASSGMESVKKAHLKKMREAEKAENVMNLICWGPN